MTEELERILITLTWVPDTTVESNVIVCKAADTVLGRDLTEMIVTCVGNNDIKLTMSYLMKLEEKYECRITFIVGG